MRGVALGDEARQRHEIGERAVRRIPGSRLVRHVEDAPRGRRRAVEMEVDRVETGGLSIRDDAGNRRVDVDAREPWPNADRVVVARELAPSGTREEKRRED